MAIIRRLTTIPYNAKPTVRFITRQSLRCDDYNPTPHKEYFTTQCLQSDASPIPHTIMPRVQCLTRQYFMMRCPLSDTPQARAHNAIPTIRCLIKQSLQCDAYNPTPHAQFLTVRFPESDASQGNTSQVKPHNAMPTIRCLTSSTLRYNALHCNALQRNAHNVVGIKGAVAETPTGVARAPSLYCTLLQCKRHNHRFCATGI